MLSRAKNMETIFLRRYEKSEDGTKSAWYEWYEKSKDGTKNPWYESSMARKVHQWYEKSGSLRNCTTAVFFVDFRYRRL